ncbi:UvrD-helicase domain-containing protein [Vibrio sp. 404]|uniref:DNA 3'-5' helicase n=2 Tax=Gammaproteobacteria TaxID=1236 RepID=A0A7W2IS43_9VIBR|nr:UvrD-helicase domain-containing protein [Vibrio marinisediminis]MBA5760944.1 UvrD-helicase domain-containing protein [Vibrio marinisediminis]
MECKLINLKYYRGLKGLSQQALAHKANVGKKTIARAEQGSTVPNSATVIKLAKALEVEPSQLWLIDTDPTSTEARHLTFKRNTISYTVEQLLAINHPPGNLQIISGAGAGKTQILAQKVCTLITDHGMKPKEIVVITFTQRAAAENRERLRKIYREEFGHERELDELFVGTIHAWCLELLQRHSPNYLSFDLIDGMQQYLFIQRYYKHIFPDGGLYYRNKNGVVSLASKSDTMRWAPKLFNLLREAHLDKSKITFGNAEECLKNYEEMLLLQHKLDFSALLCSVADLLLSDIDFRLSVVNSLKYLIIDEYQDTNYAQERVVKYLHQVSDGRIKLAVVGDDDQLIFGWNNALRENMLEFSVRYPEVERITLNHNFRSSPAIIDCSYRIVDRNLQRLSKNIKASSHHKFDPGDVLTLEFDDCSAEACWVAEKIKRMIGTPYQDRSTSEPRGLSYSDFAILVRTKKQAVIINQALEQAAVPYQFKGGPGLISSSSIGQACAGIFFYLCGSYKSQEYNREDLIDSWLKTPFKLAIETIDQAIDALDVFKVSWKDSKMHSQRSIQRCFQLFVGSLSLSEERVEYDGNPYCSPGEHAFSILGQFSQLISRFELIHFGYFPEVLYSNFANFLVYTADSQFDERLFHQQKEHDAVNVMTVHAAKGLEFPAVFMPGLVANKFPLKASGGRNEFYFIDKDAFPYPEAYRTPRDEERRLGFVGASRAEKYLFASWAPIPAGNNSFSKQSIFFEELASSDYSQSNDKEVTEPKLVPKPKSLSAIQEVDFSHLKIFNTCPYAYKLRCEYGFQPGYSERLGFGNILHSAFQEYINDLLVNKVTNENPEIYIESLVNRHFYLPYTTGFDSELRKNIHKSLIQRFKFLHEHRFDKIRGATHTEKSVSLLLSECIRLVGRMDVLRLGVGGKEVLDLKSEHSAVSHDEVVLQLMGYALGEWEQSGEVPKRISVVYADKPKRDSSGEFQTSKPDTYEVSEEQLNAAKVTLRIQAEGLFSSNKPKLPKLDKNKTCEGTCSKCDVNFICSQGNKYVTKI